MRRDFLHICLLILISSLFFGCEEVIDLDLETPKKISISAEFKADGHFEVYLFESGDPRQNNARIPIENATAEIYENNQKLQELIYVPDLVGVPPHYRSVGLTIEGGHTYTLKVNAPGFPEAVATSTVPGQSEIEGFQAINLLIVEDTSETSNIAQYIYTVDLKILEHQNDLNYYRISVENVTSLYDIVGIDTIITSDIVEKSYIYNRNLDRLYSTASGGSLIFTSELLEEVNNLFQLDVSFYANPLEEKPKELIVTLETLSEDAYLFHTTRELQTQSSTGPLNEPVIVYDNVESGCGIFAGYNVVIDTLAL